MELLLSLACVLGLGVGLWLRWAIRPPPPARPDRYLAPRDEAELIALIEGAARHGRQLRVRGSGHSIARAIHSDGAEHTDIVLDHLNRIVSHDTERLQITVEAGCNLGADPSNPNSRPEGGLMAFLDELGWALPDLAGITHQTVGGFLSTGSAGGSLTHSISEALVEIRLVDGRGRVHLLRPNPEDPEDEQSNPFYAAGVSMGLLGVITQVTFQCVERYEVIGSNRTSRVEDAAVDLFAPGPGGLREHLERSPYTRLFWWPQPKVGKVQIWSARRATEFDRATTHPGGVARPRLLHQIPLGRLGQWAYGWLNAWLNRGPRPMIGWRRRVAAGAISALLFEEDQRFWGPWNQVLAMDDEIHYDLLPCAFTELFVPLERTEEVMAALRDYFEGDEGFERTGTFATELYAGKASRFWLSPAHGQDMVRLDFIRILRGEGTPELDFFPQWWRLLTEFGARCHWGKHMPPADGPLGRVHLRSAYPMLDRFLAVRAHFDPDQVFVTAYWRDYLGIEAPAKTHSSPRSDASAGPSGSSAGLPRGIGTIDAR